VHDLPRQLTADELDELFEGPTRFVQVLAEREDPLGQARSVLEGLPESGRVEALNAHPRIGGRDLTGRSVREHGGGEEPEIADELARLNEAYEEKFGFRFVVFVDRRPRSAIVPVLRERLERSRAEELATGCDALVAIALDRWQSR
jgi:2-oxo-4-hydroxy-4-carboxy--5-ureidoimidazoline (OHCU) decarboxylase